MTHKLSSDGAAVVNECLYMHIDDRTPIGVRMILVDSRQGIAYIRPHRKGDGFDLWHPLPVMPKVKAPPRP